MDWGIDLIMICRFGPPSTLISPTGLSIGFPLRSIALRSAGVKKIFEWLSKDNIPVFNSPFLTPPTADAVEATPNSMTINSRK